MWLQPGIAPLQGPVQWAVAINVGCSVRMNAGAPPPVAPEELSAEGAKTGAFYRLGEGALPPSPQPWQQRIKADEPPEPGWDKAGALKACCGLWAATTEQDNADDAEANLEEFLLRPGPNGTLFGHHKEGTDPVAHCQITTGRVEWDKEVGRPRVTFVKRCDDPQTESTCWTGELVLARYPDQPPQILNGGWFVDANDDGVRGKDEIGGTFEASCTPSEFPPIEEPEPEPEPLRSSVPPSWASSVTPQQLHGLEFDPGLSTSPSRTPDPRAYESDSTDCG